MADMKGLVVVVTGGCRGIGFSISESFLARGATVVMADLSNSEAAESLLQRQPATASFIRCDVTTDLENVCTDVIAQHSRVDILVNNAGIADESTVRRTIDINTIAVIEWTNRFYNHMRTDTGGKGGTIINVASLNGYYRDNYFSPIYKASEHAVVAFTRTMRHEKRFEKTGVRVIALCPGFTELLNSSDTSPSSDPLIDEEIKFMKTIVWQEADVVGKAAMDVYDKAETGTVWQIFQGYLSVVSFPNFDTKIISKY